MRVVEGRHKLKAKKIGEKQLKALNHPLRLKILQELSEEHYAAELAQKFNTSDQKIHYHMKMLRNAGLVKKIGEETKRGAQANLYRATAQAFGLILEGAKKKQESNMLDYLTDSLMIVGSPDPHGPYKARARDNYYAAELCLFLGKYSPQISVKTDTELKPGDRENNLILIGGPIVNTISAEINQQLNIKFTEKNGTIIHSQKTGKDYYDEEIGLISITKNPWNENKKVIIFAGKGYKGTKSAIVAFKKHFHQIKKENVVLGLDVDGDGIIDEAEILEQN